MSVGPLRREWRYASTAAMAEATATAVAEALRGAIAARGRATLVVSGGRTPEALFRILARAELDWSAVTVTLADERWLHPDDPESNENLVRRTLLTGPAAAARLRGLKLADTEPERAARELNARLAALPRPFDVLLLGMGEDGHTASLFPCAPELPAVLGAGRDQLVAALHPTTACHARLSLTPSALRNARATWLLLAGESKWRVYQDALRAPADVAAMPVRLVLRDRKGVV